MLSYISKEIIYPVLPVYLTIGLGLSPFFMGLVEGTTKALSSITKFYSGFYSDQKQNRKKYIIIGLFGTLSQNIMFFLINNPLGILFASMMDRFGHAIKTAPADATLVENSPHHHHSLIIGLKKAFDKLGASIGIIITFFLVANVLTINFKLIFLIAIIPALFSVLLAFFIKQKNLRKKLNINISHFSTNMQFYFILIFFSAIGNSTKAFLLLRVNHLGFTAHEVIFLYLTTTLSSMVFSLLIGIISHNFAKNKLIAIAYFIFGLTYLGLAIGSNPIFIVICFILHGLFIALISIAAKGYILQNSPKEMIATAIGINECLIGLASLPAILIASGLWILFNPEASFFFSSIIAFISTFLAFKYLKNNHARDYLG